MFRPLRLDHLVLRVRDRVATQRFYCGVLGCTLEREQAQIDLWQLRAGDSIIDLVPVDMKLGAAGGAAPGREGRNVDHFCLRVEPWDADAIRAHLRAHGVDTEEPALRFGADGSGPSIYLVDPEGNTVELKGPPTA